MGKNRMESLKEKLKNRIQKKQSESKIQSWQEMAIDIIKKFQIGKEYQAIIFRHAKRNKAYLEGKVSLCVEKFGTKLEDKGAYLISLFRRKKPWE